MLLVSLHERIRRFNNEELLMLAIEGAEDTSLLEAISNELDMRSMLAQPQTSRMTRTTTPQRPSLMRWLDPATRPNLSAQPGKRSA